MRKFLWAFSFYVSLFYVIGCKNDGSVTPLPFYNTADFTPEWINDEDPKYDSIHTIGSFSFYDQNGELINEKAIKDKICIANFFFTTCPSICPVMTNNLLMVQDEFAEDTDIILLSHTVMPWIDSVATLKKYAEERDILDKKWHLLTGKQSELYEVARKSYFAEKSPGIQRDTNHFLHTENVLLIDKKSRIRGVYNGTLPLEMNRIIDDIRVLKEE